MAPSLIASYLVQSAGADTTSLVTPSFTPLNGEVIVVKAVSADTPLTFNIPTGGSQTFTSRAVSTAASNCPSAIYTAVISGSPGLMTVTLAYGGSGAWHSMVVERWTGAQLAGAPATNSTKTGTGAPSATVTTTGANSIVTSCEGDWSATAPGTPAYRSSALEDNGGAPNGHLTVSGQYTAYYFYQSAASAGAQTIGLTAPGGQTWAMIGIEIQDAGGGPPPVATPPPVNATGFAVQRAASW